MKKKWKISLGFWLVVLGISLFWTGRNNNDVCRNELQIEHSVNNLLAKNNIKLTYTIYESNSMGTIIGLSKCHSQSLLFMEIGSLIILLGGLIFGNASRTN